MTPHESPSLALDEPQGGAARVALGARAVLLRGFARERAAELIAAIDAVAAVSPCRHMVTPARRAALSRWRPLPAQAWGTCHDTRGSVGRLAAISAQVGPRVDGVVLRVIAERLANATEPDELLALAGDLVAIAGVVAKEAMCDAPATSC